MESPAESSERPCERPNVEASNDINVEPLRPSQRQSAFQIPAGINSGGNNQSVAPAATWMPTRASSRVAALQNTLQSPSPFPNQAIEGGLPPAVP